MKFPDINNAILKRCKIALKLDNDALYQIWNLGDLEVSHNAARSFFMGQGNKNYRRCSDDDILKFFDGLVRYMRDGERFDPEQKKPDREKFSWMKFDD